MQEHQGKLRWRAGLGKPQEDPKMASFACLVLCPPTTLTSGTLDTPSFRTHPKGPCRPLRSTREGSHFCRLSHSLVTCLTPQSCGLCILASLLTLPVAIGDSLHPTEMELKTVVTVL